MNYSEQLDKLKLTFLKDHLDEFLKIATKNASKAVKWWLDQELEEARLKSEKRRIAASRIGACLAQKDFDWQLIESPKDIALQIDNLITKDFVSLNRNVILIGSEGAGKTALAKILGYQAVLTGYNCLFVTTADMLTDINGASHVDAFQKSIAKYCRPHLLILDELGYVTCTENSADSLFQVISKRYDAKKPTIVTTNFAFEDWPKALGQAHCTAAIIDRLIENSSVINLIAESHRLYKHKNDRFNEE
jgi:DNA replication protein DnaC